MMSKKELMEQIAQLQAQIKKLEAQQEDGKKTSKKSSGIKSAKTEKSSPKSSRKSAEAVAPKVTLPVRKGKKVSFDGWLNYKVWSANKAAMLTLGGEYDKESRSIVFPTAKAASDYVSGFVAQLTPSQYEAEKAKIADGFKARKAEKAAASKSSKSRAKKGNLIRKDKVDGASTLVKKPEWRERAERGEKPFSKYSTYKEYWHATIGK